MATWAEFETAAPELAGHGRRLLYRLGIGLGFLATVRHADGGPRVHPVCPIIAQGRLFVFVVEMSPKLRDLDEDGRFALHCFPADLDEEFYVTGTARRALEPGLRERVVAATGGKLGTHDFEVLVALDLEHALHTTWENWGQPHTRPRYEKWHAPRAGR
jgi:hypothetical protein